MQELRVERALHKTIAQGRRREHFIDESDTQPAGGKSAGGTNSVRFDMDPGALPSRDKGHVDLGAGGAAETE